MKKFLVLLPFLAGVGVLRADLEVGDQLTVPVTVMMLNLTRDYPSTTPATVTYKDDNMYIMAVPAVRYIMHKDKPTYYLDTTLVDEYTSQLASLFPQVKSDVLNYFGITEDDLYDSDNDPRIYFIILPMYVTDQAVNAGITLPNKVTALFDPHYSVSTMAFPRHEIIYINARSIITNSTGFDLEVLKKTLYIYYTAYVMWSLDMDERVGDLMKLAVYMASKIDTSSDYFTGVDDVPDARNGGAPLGYDGNMFIYNLNKILSTDDMNAELGYIWLNYLEELFGESSIVSMASSPDFISNEIDELFRQNNKDFLTVVEDFYLKAALSGWGFGSQYEFENPALQGRVIFDFKSYPNKNNWYIRPYDSTANRDSLGTLEAWGVYGFSIRVPFMFNKPAVVNYPDNLTIKTYFIDFDEHIVEPIATPEHMVVNGLDTTNVALLMNLNNVAIPLWYQYGDTIPPVVEKFFVMPNISAMNVFDIYSITNEEVCMDVSNCKAGITVTVPGALSPISVSAGMMDEYSDSAGRHYVYHYRFEVPVLREGTYKFSLSDISDPVDNRLSDTLTTTVEVAHLNIATSHMFYDGKIVIGSEKPMVIAVSSVEEEIMLSSNVKNAYVELKIKSAPDKVIYTQRNGIWLPVESYYQDGYVSAVVPANGKYRVLSGQPKFSDKFEIRLIDGGRLIINLPYKTEFRGAIYSVNGRVSSRITLKGSGVHIVDIGNLPHGIYYIQGTLGNKNIKQTIVLY